MSLLSAVLQEVEKASSQEFSKHRNVVLPKVKELNDKIQTLSWSLQENIIDNYYNFTATKSLEQLNYRYRKETIEKDYKEVEEDIKNVRGKFDVVDDDFQKSTAKLEESFTLFKSLCVAAEGKRVLQQANHEFTRYNYCVSMESMSKLREQLKQMKFEGNLATAVTNLISQAENQYSLCSAELSVEWEDIFSWSEKKGLYYHTYSLCVQQSDPVVIKNILRTLYTTKRLNIELALFSKFFLDKILPSVIEHNCEIFTEDVMAPNDSIVFNIKIDLEDQSKPNFQAVFNNLMAIFDFIQSTLGSQLESEKSFIAVLADSIRGKFFKKIIDDCIRNNLPSCDSSYANYKNLVLELDAFNKFLVELDFVSADNSPLNKFVNDTECVLYNKKCDKLLNDVRSLLNKTLSYGTIVVGTEIDNNSVLDVTDKESVWDLDKPLFLPRCVISQNVKSILTLIVHHLVESTKLPEKYSEQLIAYIRSIVVMYQCIVPQKFKVNLEHCPLDIALFFNNCFYLAHGLIGPPWRSVLPSAMAQRLTIVALECVQDLRLLGLEKVSTYLQNKKDEISRNVYPDEQILWTHESFEHFDCSINDALALMHSLKHSWHHILPTRMYEMSLCALAQALCQSALQRVLANGKPVEEELVYLIAVRFEDVVNELVKLFENPLDLDKKIEAWTKFKIMPQILKAQLLELSVLWKSSKELSHSYTCEEVRQIIKMRFPDDKYRLRILVEIQ